MHDLRTIITRLSFGALRVGVGAECWKIVFLGGTFCSLVQILIL